MSQKLYSVHWVFFQEVSQHWEHFTSYPWKNCIKASGEAWVNVSHNIKKHSRSLRHRDFAAVKSNIHPLSTYSWFHLRWKKKKKRKCIHALVCFRFPVEWRTWLHYTVWDLFKNAFWRSGKAFKHDIRPRKSLLLLDVAAHSNAAAEDWRKHWRNAHQHRVRALSWKHTLI